MRVLVGCERSGVVRQAFRKLGHDAWSLDIEPADDGSPFHRQMDLTKHIREKGGFYDLAVFHPPCTHLAVSGARYFKEKRADGRQQAAIEFFMMCVNFDCPRVCVENPVSIMSTVYRKPDQVLQPWWFGHPESKATCLWLKNLPKLTPTKVVTQSLRHCHGCGAYYPAQFKNGTVHCPNCGCLGRLLWNNQTPSGQNKLGPSPDRAKIRSTTYTGIAEAFANQWGIL